MDLHNVFEGHTVTIVGGGPSLVGFNFDHLKQPVIALNFAVKYVPNEMFCCIDVPFMNSIGMNAFLDTYPGYKVSMRNITSRTDFTMVKITPNHETRDLDWHIAKVNLTGFFAIAVALHLGAKLIYLLGFDGGFDDPARPDWYPLPEEWAVGPGQNTFHEQNAYYDFFTDKKIINVGSTSRIDSFPKVGLYTDFYKKNYHELLRNFTSR